MADSSKARFGTFVMLNGIVGLEVIDLAVEELHAKREACGVSEDHVKVYIEAVSDLTKTYIRVRMEEVRDELDETCEEWSQCD